MSLPWDHRLRILLTVRHLILDAVARVQEVNLDGVVATSHPQPIKNVFREDVVHPSLTPDQALSGAPAQEEQRFRVPQILGEAE
jgi:aspartyl-tRNA(Asn)/glutamyl-tRNA(Gln) amidotransferase subunit C